MCTTGSGSTRKRKGGATVVGSSSKTSSNNSNKEQPTSIGVQSSYEDEHGTKVLLTTLTSKSLKHQKTVLLVSFGYSVCKHA